LISSTKAVAYIYKGDKLSAYRRIVVENSCIEFGVVESIVFSIGGALVFDIGLKCLFRDMG
jgi:hypothetical protein